MKKKLILKDLKVKSFVTEVEKDASNLVVGGLQIQTQNNGYCSVASCGIACTRDILHCI